MKGKRHTTEQKIRILREADGGEIFLLQPKPEADAQFWDPHSDKRAWNVANTANMRAATNVSEAMVKLDDCRVSSPAYYGQKGQNVR